MKSFSSLWRREASTCFFAFALLSATAHADDAPVEHAQALFNVGAQAYAQGEFIGAIEAFEEAYRASPRPGILFSIAQAHRKQFYVARAPANLRAAIKHYHAYLGTVSTGKYRVIAAEALAELEAAAEKAGINTTPTQEAPAEKPRTRVMVSSAIEGARVALDDAPLKPSPLIADVTPGKHAVRTEAEGYVADRRSLIAVEGGLVALDVPLKERPARLSIRAPDGAEVVVDRRLVGRTPLSEPIELPAGEHFVAVTKNGRRPYAEEIKLARGESRSINAELAGTGQRVVSYFLAAAAGAGVALGGIFVGLAFYEEGQAESIHAASLTHNITQPMLDQYNGALGSRQDYTNAAYGVLGGALAVGIGAGILYLFDTPRAPTTFVHEEGPARKAPTATPLEMSAIPLAGPGFVGAGILGRF